MFLSLLESQIKTLLAIYWRNELLSGVMQGQECLADRVAWLLCHLQVAGDKRLFMTLSSSSLVSD